MQFGGQGKPSLGVLYDADFGSTIDVPLALAVLYGLQVKNESRVVSVTTSRPSINSAAFADVLVRFYTGEPGGFVQAQSIGMPTGTAPEDTPMIAGVLAKPYSRGIKKLNDTADPVAVLRNALSAQFDGNATVVMAGPPTNLAKLLDLPGAKELIARKAKMLCVAGRLGGPRHEEAAGGMADGDRRRAEGGRRGAAVPGVRDGEGAGVGAGASDCRRVAGGRRERRCRRAPWPRRCTRCGRKGFFKLSEPGTLREDGSFAPSSGGKHGCSPSIRRRRTR